MFVLPVQSDAAGSEEQKAKTTVDDIPTSTKSTPPAFTIKEKDKHHSRTSCTLDRRTLLSDWCLSDWQWNKKAIITSNN